MSGEAKDPATWCYIMAHVGDHDFARTSTFGFTPLFAVVPRHPPKNACISYSLWQRADRNEGPSGV